MSQVRKALPLYILAHQRERVRAARKALQHSVRLLGVRRHDGDAGAAVGPPPPRLPRGKGCELVSRWRSWRGPWARPAAYPKVASTGAKKRIKCVSNARSRSAAVTAASASVNGSSTHGSHTPCRGTARSEAPTVQHACVVRHPGPPAPSRRPACAHRQGLLQGARAVLAGAGAAGKAPVDERGARRVELERRERRGLAGVDVAQRIVKARQRWMARRLCRECRARSATGIPSRAQRPLKGPHQARARWPRGRRTPAGRTSASRRLRRRTHGRGRGSPCTGGPPSARAARRGSPRLRAPASPFPAGTPRAATGTTRRCLAGPRRRPTDRASAISAVSHPRPSTANQNTVTYPGWARAPPPPSWARRSASAGTATAGRPRLGQSTAPTARRAPPRGRSAHASRAPGGGCCGSRQRGGATSR